MKKCSLQSNAKFFPMPLSLQYIKELSEAGIAWKSVHVIDAFSLVCSIRIESCKKILARRSRERMDAAGIQEIASASETDFDAL